MNSKAYLGEADQRYLIFGSQHNGETRADKLSRQDKLCINVNRSIWMLYKNILNFNRLPSTKSTVSSSLGFYFAKALFFHIITFQQK